MEIKIISILFIITIMKPSCNDQHDDHDDHGRLYTITIRWKEVGGLLEDRLILAQKDVVGGGQAEGRDVGLELRS